MLLVPAGLLLGAILFYLNRSHMAPVMLTVTGYAPYALFVAAAAMSWWFNRSRVFFCVLAMGFSQLLLTINLPLETDAVFFRREADVFIAIFIPLNFLVFAFLKERGIFTLWGFLRMAFLFVQGFSFLWWVGSEKRSLSPLFSVNFLFENWSIFQNLSQIAILVNTAVFVVLAVRGVLHKSYLDMAFTAGVPMIATAVGLQGQDFAVPVFFSFAGLALMIALMQDSYNMAFLDELTGLPSRRALRHELLKLSGRYTIAMLDIDFFKKFNDTYGHDVGDQVLRMVASVIRDVTGGGKPFRYGGEEFTVVFPGKSVKEAGPYLEELREAVSKRGFIQRSRRRSKNKPKKGKGRSSGGKELFVTVSIGVAEKSEKHRQPEDVIKAADTALYRAKKKGRNCVSK